MTSAAIAPAVTKPRTIEIHDSAINHCGIKGCLFAALPVGCSAVEVWAQHTLLGRQLTAFPPFRA